MPISVGKKRGILEVITVRTESTIQKTAPSPRLTQNIEPEKLVCLLSYSCTYCSSSFAPSLEVL